VVEPAPVATAHTHTVQKGETLLKVAQRYGMTLTELKQINKLRTERATAGTRLTVATLEPAVKPAPAGQRTTLARSEDGKQASPRSDATAIAVTRSHAVRKGETLSEIASRYDMTLAELKQINKLRVNQVNAGTRLAVAAPEPVSKPLAGKSRSEMAEVESRQDKAARSGRQDVARVDVKTAEKAANKARDASEQTTRQSRPGRAARNRRSWRNTRFVVAIRWFRSPNSSGSRRTISCAGIASRATISSLDSG